MFKNDLPPSTHLSLTGGFTSPPSFSRPSSSDGEHPQDLRLQEPSGDDLLRPAQRRPSGRRVSRQGPEHGRLSDHGAHPGLLRPAAGGT